MSSSGSVTFKSLPILELQIRIRKSMMDIESKAIFIVPFWRWKLIFSWGNPKMKKKKVLPVHQKYFCDHKSLTSWQPYSPFNSESCQNRSFKLNIKFFMMFLLSCPPHVCPKLHFWVNFYTYPKAMQEKVCYILHFRTLEKFKTLATLFMPVGKLTV